jgi:NADPH2:quinone reductase
MAGQKSSRSISNLPYIPGFDGAGVVEGTGSGVSRFKAGDRVYTSATVSGSYAEYAICNVQTVHPLPGNVSFAQGAALGIPYATAYRALFQKAHAQPGETVLVHGASGGVGTAAVQWARAAGLTVIGTSGSAEGQKLVKENGAHHVLDHRSENYTQELMQLTSNQGVDVILEMLANVNLGKDLSLLAKFGRVVVIGSRAKVEILPRDTMSRDASIIGMTLFNAPPADLKRNIAPGHWKGTATL